MVQCCHLWPGQEFSTMVQCCHFMAGVGIFNHGTVLPFHGSAEICNPGTVLLCYGQGRNCNPGTVENIWQTLILQPWYSAAVLRPVPNFAALVQCFHFMARAELCNLGTVLQFHGRVELCNPGTVANIWQTLIL